MGDEACIRARQDAACPAGRTPATNAPITAVVVVSTAGESHGTRPWGHGRMRLATAGAVVHGGAGALLPSDPSRPIDRRVVTGRQCGWMGRRVWPPTPLDAGGDALRHAVGTPTAGGAAAGTAWSAASLIWWVRF